MPLYSLNHRPFKRRKSKRFRSKTGDQRDNDHRGQGFRKAERTYLVPDVVKAIKENAYTGQIGDGKIFIFTIKKALRIRTGEEDEDAL
jgi:hypothetical protein